MREDTKKRLDQAIRREWLKKIGIGLGILSLIGIAFGYETLDLKVTNTDMGGVVADIEPLVSKQNSADGENVVVRLTDGELVRVLAYKSRGLKVGDKITVVAHHHATGRVTHTLR